MTSYMSLSAGLNLRSEEAGVVITRDDYDGGYTLYAYDLTPDLVGADGHVTLMRQGNIRLEVHFATPLPRTVSCVIYAAFDNVIEIDKARTVHLDYGS